MCPAVTPLGRLNTSTTQATVREPMSTVTVALPNAPVLRPGAGVSFEPSRVAVSVKVWADAGAAASVAAVKAANSRVFERRIIRFSSRLAATGRMYASRVAVTKSRRVRVLTALQTPTDGARPYQSGKEDALGVNRSNPD